MIYTLRYLYLGTYKMSSTERDEVVVVKQKALAIFLSLCKAAAMYGVHSAGTASLFRVLINPRVKLPLESAKTTVIT